MDWGANSRIFLMSASGIALECAPVSNRPTNVSSPKSIGKFNIPLLILSPLLVEQGEHMIVLLVFPLECARRLFRLERYWGLDILLEVLQFSLELFQNLAAKVQWGPERVCCPLFGDRPRRPLVDSHHVWIAGFVYHIVRRPNTDLCCTRSQYIDVVVFD